MHTDYKHDSSENFEYNAFEYVEYLRTRWKLIAVVCVASPLLALGISLLLPKRYTATASIIIDPPAGNDLRTATAVSPIYLESLKTYEAFALSDTLFERAVEKFHLLSSASPRTIESLKQQVLKVTKIRDTKILEISATLRDPEVALQLTRFLTEETVHTSRVQSLEGDRDLIEESERQAAEAKKRLDAVQHDAAELALHEPVEALETGIEADVDLAAKVRQQLIEAQGDAADYQEREKTGDSYAKEQLPGIRARAATLEKKLVEMQVRIDQSSTLVSRRKAERQKIDSELKMAQTASESTAGHLRDLRAASGMRGERLRIVDPGIVPQKPSSPNIPLNVIAALLVSFVGSIVWLSLSFSYRRNVLKAPTTVSRQRRAG